MTPEGKKQLESDEGRRSLVYFDSVGIPTIGVGRNLQAKGLANDEIDFMFNNDILDCEEALYRIFPKWNSFSPHRQDALVNMVFNLGVGGFIKFKNMISAIQRDDWLTAARECRDSKAATDRPDRYERIAKLLEEV